MHDYQPTSRRPIAELFRATARLPVRWCVRLGVHPDAVSYASIAASAGAVACFWQSGGHVALLVPAVALCYVRLWCNMLDGMVALAAGKASLRGEVLNDLPDRVSDVLIFAGVAHSGLCITVLAYWVIIAALLVAYVGVLGQSVGAGRQYGGVMSKPWRMVALSAGAAATLLLRCTNQPSGWLGFTAIDWTHLLILAGAAQTAAVRLSRIMKALRTADRSKSVIQP